MSKPTKKTYYCLNAVRHNGKRYTTEIDLTTDEAKPLLSVKAITKTNPNAAAEAAAKEIAEAAAAEAAKKKAADKEADKKVKADGAKVSNETAPAAPESPKAPTADAK